MSCTECNDFRCEHCHGLDEECSNCGGFVCKLCGPQFRAPRPNELPPPRPLTNRQRARRELGEKILLAQTSSCQKPDPSACLVLAETFIKHVEALDAWDWEQRKKQGCE
jgi:hypothetical protein